MPGSDTAAMVGPRYDLLVDGFGYVLDRTWNPDSLRHPPTAYKFTPTFLERTNVGAGYGDDQQAFWLTASQNDWSLGEQQRFFRATDADSVRRYYRGLN